MLLRVASEESLFVSLQSLDINIDWQNADPGPGQEAGQREGEGLRGDDCSLDTFPGRLISISATKGFIRRHSPRTRRARRSQVNGGAAKTSSVLRIETFSGPWSWGSLNMQRYIYNLHNKKKPPTCALTLLYKRTFNKLTFYHGASEPFQL